jgi:hypothetical protein
MACRRAAWAEWTCNSFGELGRVLGCHTGRYLPIPDRHDRLGVAPCAHTAPLPKVADQDPPSIRASFAAPLLRGCFFGPCVWIMSANPALSFVRRRVYVGPDTHSKLLAEDLPCQQRGFSRRLERPACSQPATRCRKADRRQKWNGRERRSSATMRWRSSRRISNPAHSPYA